MLRLWSLWSCGDRGSDLHQIPRPIGPVQRTRTEAAPLRMDVAQFDISVTHQPVAVLGLGDADRLADRVGPYVGLGARLGPLRPALPRRRRGLGMAHDRYEDIDGVGCLVADAIAAEAK